jgi:hypothetical protein
VRRDCILKQILNLTMSNLEVSLLSVLSTAQLEKDEEIERLREQLLVGAGEQLALRTLSYRWQQRINITVLSLYAPHRVRLIHFD